MTARFAFLAGLALTPLGAAAAQSAPIIQPGDRVRIEAANVRGDFDVVTWTESDRQLRVRRHSAELSVALDSVRQLKVMRGHESRGNTAGRRGGIGLIIGAVVGGTIGFLSGDDPDDSFFAFTAGEKAALAGGTLGAVGLVVGAFSGLVSPSARWERVVPPTRIGLVRPRAGGLALALRTSF